MSFEKNTVILYDTRMERWLKFTYPLQVISADNVADVPGALREIESKVSDGLWAAGFVSYEASPAFDSALTVKGDDGNFPLLWFGLYNAPETLPTPAPSDEEAESIPWQADISEDDYARGFKEIKDAIAHGDTYQVNYTFRLRAQFDGDAWSLFTRMARAQGSGYPVFVQTADWTICSASPELFFTLDGGTLTSKPMKGTAARKPTPVEDRAQAHWLYRSEKNRAENVMIVDMVRNDMGRIARLGSVRVPHLFAVEKYRTVWQMTSTVQCETDAGLADIFRALFPASSITGAPKARTMQIIAALEKHARRIYTGALGFFAPGRVAQFNVAIRSVWIDQHTWQAEYGLGGGIVWDSENRDELQEAYTKARILTQPTSQFDLLETILWEPGSGFRHLDAHLARLAESADYFSTPVAVDALREKLSALTVTLAPRPQRVRVLVAPDGETRLEARPLTVLPNPYRVCLVRRPIQSRDVFLYHKTTWRKAHDEARELSDCDDVILFNERGELTESCIANLVIERNGEWLTPPVECGLLPGIERARLLADGKLREAILSVEDLYSADGILLVNSVRGVWQATLQKESE